MMTFQVLNFKTPNDTKFIFGEHCFNRSLSHLQDLIDRDCLYGELNPLVSKLTNVETIENIDRERISHKVVKIYNLNNNLIADIEPLRNVNGLALKCAIDYSVNIRLRPRIILISHFELPNKFVRVNEAKLITLDIRTDEYVYDL